MILGIFLIRPIPLPVQENTDPEGTVSFPLEPHNSSHAPLLEYDFAESVHSNSAHRTGANNGHFGESYLMEDVQSRDGADISTQPSFQTVILDQKPNLHGKELWLSGDFWLFFAILSIRRSSFTSYFIVNILIARATVSGTTLMCMCL